MMPESCLHAQASVHACMQHRTHPCMHAMITVGVPLALGGSGTPPGTVRLPSGGVSPPPRYGAFALGGV